LKKRERSNIGKQGRDATGKSSSSSSNFVVEAEERVRWGFGKF